MKKVKYIGTVSPWVDSLGGSGLTWTTGMEAVVSEDVGDELTGYPALFEAVAGFDGNGVTPEKVEQAGGGSSVSGDKARVHRFGAVGDSLIAGAAVGGSPFEQAVRRSGINRATSNNYAVAGRRTDEIASQIPTALAAGCNAVVVGGGVNDILQSVAVAARRAQWIANINAVLAGGARPIAMGLPPTNTATNAPAYAKDEIYRRLWCLKNDVQHIDAWSPLATGAGAFRAGLNVDSIHYNAPGAIALAPEVAQAINSPGLRTSPMLLALTDTYTDAGSCVQNAVSFADSNADGLADLWAAYGSGGVYSITPQESPGFGAWQRCTLSAATDVGFNNTALTLASLGWSVGDRVAIGFRVRIQSGVALKAYTTGITSANPQPLFNEPGTADILVYHEQTIVSGTAIGIRFFGSGTGYFEVNRPIIVNLTQLGFS